MVHASLMSFAQDTQNYSEISWSMDGNLLKSNLATINCTKCNYISFSDLQKVTYKKS